MKRVWVVLENTYTRKVFPPEMSVPEILGHLSIWIAAGQAKVRESGVCKSFTIGLHVEGPDCDHEVKP